MPSAIFDFEGKREIQPVFWIIDTSASMSGERIKIIEDILVKFTKMSKNNDKFEIETVILSFNTKVEWVSYDGLNTEVLKLNTEGITNVGLALQELNFKLSQDGFCYLFKTSRIERCPIILFILDGYSTDNYKNALEELKKNRWFRVSIKLGLAIGSEADTELLESIVGDELLFNNKECFLQALNRILNERNLHMCIDGSIADLDLDDFNEIKNSTIVEKNILLPSSTSEQFEANMFIEIFIEINHLQRQVKVNHFKHQMKAGEYRIVRCQLETCDLQVAGQECLVANVLHGEMLVRLTNIAPVPYIVSFNLKTDEHSYVGIKLFHNMSISGNVQLSMKDADTYDILGMSEESKIAVFLGQGKFIDLKVGKKYEIETLSSKVSIIFSDERTWDDEWGDDW